MHTRGPSNINSIKSLFFAEVPTHSKLQASPWAPQPHQASQPLIQGQWWGKQAGQGCGERAANLFLESQRTDIFGFVRLMVSVTATPLAV